MPPITYDSNLGTLAVKYGDASNLVSKTTMKVMQRIGMKLHAYMLREKLRGGAINYRTGNLSRAAFYRVEMIGADEILVRVGVAMEKARYARIQDQGGVITPKNAQYLTVPLDAAKTGNGVPRFTARELFDGPKAFGYTGAFVHNGVIFGVKERTRGKSGGKAAIGTIVPLFALKRSITIKATHFIGETLSENLSMIREELGVGMGELGPQLGGDGS